MTSTLGRGRAAIRRLPRPALLAAVLAFANAALWAIITPPWQGPDEYAHSAYVQYLAETGKSPGPHGARPFASSEEVLALNHAATVEVLGLGHGKAPWTALQYRIWRERDARQRPSPDDGGGPSSATIHGSAYYGAGAAGYLLAKAAGGTVFDRLFAVRLVSALMAALTVLCVFGFVREAVGGPPYLAAVAALAAAFQPMFGFISGVVNNDALVILCVSALLYLLARAIRRGLSPALAAGVGAVTVLGLVAKLSMIPFVGVAGVGLLLAVRRWRSRAAPVSLAAALAGAAAVLAVWAALAGALDRPVLTLKSQEPNAGVPTFAGRHPSLSGFGSYLVQMYSPIQPGFIEPIFKEDPYAGCDQWARVYAACELWITRFWGAFGWLDTHFPDAVYAGIAAALLALFTLAAIAAWRHRAALRRRWRIVALSTVAVAAMVLFVHYAFYASSTVFPAEQGRYFFPAMPVYGAILAGACMAFGRRWAPAIGAAAVASIFALNLFSQGLVLLRFFA